MYGTLEKHDNLIRQLSSRASFLGRIAKLLIAVLSLWTDGGLLDFVGFEISYAEFGAGRRITAALG